MYHQFDIQQFYTLATVYLCALCWYENKQRLFPYTTLTDWFFITETECVYCAVRTGSLSVIEDHLIWINLNVQDYWCNAHVMYGKAGSDLTEISFHMWCGWPQCCISKQLTGLFILESPSFLLLLCQDGSYWIQTRELSPSYNSSLAVNCISLRRLCWASFELRTVPSSTTV